MLNIDFLIWVISGKCDEIFSQYALFFILLEFILINVVHGLVTATSEENSLTDIKFFFLLPLSSKEIILWNNEWNVPVLKKSSERRESGSRSDHNNWCRWFERQLELWSSNITGHSGRGYVLWFYGNFRLHECRSNALVCSTTLCFVFDQNCTNCDHIWITRLLVV